MIFGTSYIGPTSIPLRETNFGIITHLGMWHVFAVDHVYAMRGAGHCSTLSCFGTLIHTPTCYDIEQQITEVCRATKLGLQSLSQFTPHSRRFSVAVTLWCRSTQLRYILSPVSSGMCDCLRAAKLSHYVPCHPGQLSLSSVRGR